MVLDMSKERELLKQAIEIIKFYSFIGENVEEEAVPEEAVPEEVIFNSHSRHSSR